MLISANFNDIMRLFYPCRETDIFQFVGLLSLIKPTTYQQTVSPTSPAMWGLLHRLVVILVVVGILVNDTFVVIIKLGGVFIKEIEFLTTVIVRGVHFE